MKEKYEELLTTAKVKQHVPTLTEGAVIGAFRHHQKEKDKQEQ